MLDGRGLSYLVPIILNCSVPKVASQHLIRSSSGTVRNTERLHFIEIFGVGLAGQRRRRAGTKLIRAVQRERGNVRPVSELRLLRKIRRCRLVVSRRIPEDIGYRCGVGSIVAPLRQDLRSHSYTYADAVGFFSAVRNLSQRILKLSIKRRLERWIGTYQDIMCCLSGRCVLRGIG